MDGRNGMEKDVRSISGDLRDIPESPVASEQNAQSAHQPIVSEQNARADSSDGVLAPISREAELPAAMQAGQASAGKHAGKPPKVLATSLGMVLAVNLLAVPVLQAEGTDGTQEHQPRLVEWSSDAVKPYYNPGVDWNITLPGGPANGSAGTNGPGGTQQPQASPAPASGTGGSTVIVNEGGGGSGFGWDDILLYHLLFNSGRTFSTSAWTSQHTVIDNRTHQTYQPHTYNADAFNNRPVEGSTVRPKTSSAAGSFTSKSGMTSSSGAGGASSKSGSQASSGSGSVSGKSTSSAPGGIGGKSGSFSSSGKSSGSSFGS